MEGSETTPGPQKDNGFQGLANSVADGDSHRLADVVSAVLQSVTTHYRAIKPEDRFSIGADYNMPDKYVISTSQVEKQMRAIKTSKARGSDDIPDWILKEFAECLSGPLFALFNSSLRQGHVPQVWKSAICPLTKVPSPSAIEKHLRPISLTPTVSKVLERYVAGWGNGHCQGHYRRPPVRQSTWELNR